jgi:hypothetical protein
MVDVNYELCLGFNVLKLELKKFAGQKPGVILQKITIAYTSLLIIDLIFDVRDGIILFIPIFVYFVCFNYIDLYACSIKHFVELSVLSFMWE